MNHTLRYLAALLSLLFLTNAALARENDPADSPSTWPELDLGLDRLDAALGTTSQDGPRFSGYISTLYADNDISGSDQGFFMNALRLNVDGTMGEYNWRISIEGNSDEPLLNDAYLRLPEFMGTETTIGLFKKPVLHSGLIEANRTMYIGRTRNGLLYSVRDWGVMISDKNRGVEMTLAVQNGADGGGDDPLLTGRVDVDLLGDGRLEHEGAYGAGRNQRLNASYAWSDDRESNRGRVRAFDFAYAHKRWSVAGEVLRYDSGYNAAPAPFEGQFTGGTTPWTWTVSYLLCSHCTELALRFEDLSDGKRVDSGTGEITGERTRTTLGLNHYVDGHDFKWQVNYGKFEDAGGETDWAALGLVLSF
ncbi:MAG: hypothetical protein QF724_07345 [Planctomycetota bacterium]|jgi:hypothetical protein|nr:hypothetical protein [Planctomycetota bacterium]MDP6519942.1 hypothetical protein [Planctomycetota bacterium]MDP6838734.1 hypothetical protein [Planctomycetota bacterium]MDP6955145.1 hypothetical protein [Planctomycetota bacterium]